MALMNSPEGDNAVSPSRLLPGSECIITDLQGEPAVTQRLAEMGVLPGSRLRVVRIAPLGDTLEVALEEGQLLALRKDELAALGCDYRVLPLSEARYLGKGPYRVHGLAGGRLFHERMARQGIEAGKLLQPVDTDGPALVVELAGRETPLHLGHGEAEKILVEPADG